MKRLPCYLNSDLIRNDKGRAVRKTARQWARFARSMVTHAEVVAKVSESVSGRAFSIYFEV